MADDIIKTFPGDDYHPHFQDSSKDLFARKMRLARLLQRAEELGVSRFLLFNMDHTERLNCD